MNRKSCYSVLLGATIMLTGCSKKMNQFQADYFTVNPNPLEVVGEKVPATVTANVPAKFFKKNAEVTVTPYLVYNGTETASTSYTFQGEKVRGNNPVINYENGGTVTIPVSYLYQPEMAQSVLSLAFNVKQGNKQYVLPRVDVATGVIATAAMADAGNANPAITPDKFQRIINEKYAADILFLINVANIRANQLNTQSMEDLRAQIKKANDNDRLDLKEINIKSYASPDGPLGFNTKLAENREKNTMGYVEKQLKKDDITKFGELTAHFTPEDWDGFKKLVSESNLQDKELILSVLSMYQDPETREREIRNMAAIFDQLADDILPQLRYSRITASVDVIGKSDDEIKAAFAKDPSTLTVDEILYCATLTDNNGEQLKIYEAAAKLYPNDYRTLNNLGMAQYRAGKYDAAKKSFAQAARLAPKNGEPQLNLGLAALKEGDYAAAQKYFGNAAGVNELNEALGAYYLKQGDNAAAARALAGVKSNNAALAQILNKDYSAAKTTLSGIANPDATTYYLMAVLGARTNNENMITTNLRQAIKLDQNMAKRAATDLEFARYNLSSAL